MLFPSVKMPGTQPATANLPIPTKARLGAPDNYDIKMSLLLVYDYLFRAFFNTIHTPHIPADIQVITTISIQLNMLSTTHGSLTITLFIRIALPRFQRLTWLKELSISMLYNSNWKS